MPIPKLSSGGQTNPFFPRSMASAFGRYEFDPLFGKEGLGPKHERREVSITLKICL